MARLEVFILCLSVVLSIGELLGPESRKEKPQSSEDDDNADALDTDTRVINSEYIKELTDAVNKEIVTLQEYAEAVRKTKGLPKSDETNKENQLEQMEFTLKLLKKNLLRHTESGWNHDEARLELTNTEIEDKMEENPQDILDSLPPESPEMELPPQLELAKEIFDTAMERLNRRSPEVNALIGWVKDAAEAGYTPAQVKLAWSYVFGEGVDMDLERGRKMFEELAAKGVADAHAGLGFLYATGISVPVSQAKALVHYTIGAIGDSDFAQMALAYRYWAGVTVPHSCSKAMDLYMKVAAKVSSGVSVGGGGGGGVQRVRIADDDAAGAPDHDLIEYYQLLAEKGDVQAQVGLGQLHLQGGRGVALDASRALHYFRQAAAAGNAVANAFLGKIYLEGGDGIKADNETALRYFRKAAELNNPVGQSGLGIMYLQGRGVPKDTSAAFKYFTMSANQGWVEGQLHLGFMYFGGIGVRRDFKQANKYFSLASQSGNVLALYHLAQMHAQGLGVMRSCTTATELFKNVCERGAWGARLMSAHAAWRARFSDAAFVQYSAAAERGYDVAQTNAAHLLHTGEVSLFPEPERFPRALQLWSRAASQGCATARLKLGDYHYYGWGTPVDLDAAAMHYRIASEHLHNAQATFNLGYMHERGLGLARDAHLAKRCYDLAADTAADARLPAALALARMNVAQALTGLAESVYDSPLAVIFLTGGESSFLSNWDLYLITCLLGSLGVLVYMRRPQPAN